MRNACRVGSLAGGFAIMSCAAAGSSTTAAARAANVPSASQATSSDIGCAVPPNAVQVTAAARAAAAQIRAEHTDEHTPGLCANCRTSRTLQCAMPRSSCTHNIICEGCYQTLDAACEGDEELADVMRLDMCVECRAQSAS